MARGDGSFARRLMQLAKLDLLVRDDLAIAPIAAHERHDLLELLNDRAGTRSTLIAHHQPVAHHPGTNGSASPPSPTPSWTGCCTAPTPSRSRIRHLNAIFRSKAVHAPGRRVANLRNGDV